MLISDKSNSTLVVSSIFRTFNFSHDFGRLLG